MKFSGMTHWRGIRREIGGWRGKRAHHVDEVVHAAREQISSGFMEGLWRLEAFEKPDVAAYDGKNRLLVSFTGEDQLAWLILVRRIQCPKPHRCISARGDDDVLVTWIQGNLHDFLYAQKM